MTNEEIDDVLIVPLEETKGRFHTVWGVRGRDIAVGYENCDGEHIVFELDHEYRGLSSMEIANVPAGDKIWFVEPDELWAIITVLANCEAARPDFYDFFLTLREYWKIISYYADLPMPELFSGCVNKDMLTLSNNDSSSEFLIRLMINLTKKLGIFNHTFPKRYIVCNETPTLFETVDEAITEKLLNGGSLLDLKR